MKIKPIDLKLRPLLDEFLNAESLQPKFAEISKRLGYTGSDPEKIKISLFEPNKRKEICFASDEVYDMFVEYQIAEVLHEQGVPRDLAPEIFAQLILECKDLMNSKEFKEISY
jgi:hypothetical protein